MDEILRREDQIIDAWNSRMRFELSSQTGAESLPLVDVHSFRNLSLGQHVNPLKWSLSLSVQFPGDKHDFF
jgi:hypothetical protein